jgi:hypothetical protein
MSDSLKRKIIYASLGIGLCLLVFAGYELLYTADISEYAKEFVAGCIGSIIVIFATAALLKSQSDSEIRKEQIAGIFKEKLGIYMGFIEFLNGIQTDGELTQEELKRMVEWGSKLALFCRPHIIRVIYEYIVQIVAFGADDYDDLSEEEKVKWKKWQKEYYTDFYADFDENEEFWKAQYANISGIIATLRDDLTERSFPDMEEEAAVQENIYDLWTLHAVESVEFCDDNSLIVTRNYDQSKRPTRKPSARKKPAAQKRVKPDTAK